jgi:hypothetical protein|nr:MULTISPECIES: hypothetical protein [unclassified Methylobacterium]
MQAPHAYNVFRRKQQSALRCAVPQDQPVPTFLHGGDWEFGGTIKGHEPTPAGFRPEAASDAVRLNGFYLYHALRAQ